MLAEQMFGAGDICRHFHLHHRMTILRLSTHLECGTDQCRYKYLVNRWIDPIRREEALKEMSGNL